MMGLLNRCLPIFPTFSRSLFMFGEQIWKPTFFVLDNWKAILSILTETLPPQVPKRFAKSLNLSPKISKKLKEKNFRKS